MKINKRKYIVHAILKCLLCDWTCEEYKIAEKEAEKHIREKDHEVQGELGYGYQVYGS